MAAVDQPSRTPEPRARGAKLALETPPPPRRNPRAVALSVALHVVGGAALLRVLAMPYGLQSWLRREHHAPLPVERISFLALPQSSTAASTPGRSGGNGRPETPTHRPPPPAPPLVAPPEVPSTIPPAPSSVPAPPAPAAEPGSGPIIGDPGPARGIRPSYSDERLWVPPSPVVAAPKTSSQRLDSALATRIVTFRDSVALANPAPSKFDRGDWTVEHNGKKYGIDRQFIRLGKVSIPTAVLALLPLNAQANPTQLERDRALALQRREILDQAQHAMNEDEFRAAVKRIRERKERERKEQQDPAAKQPIADPKAP